MKIKATLEVEYEVDPDQYTFSKPDDKKESILKLERISLADDFNCLIAPGRVTVVKIEEVEDKIEDTDAFIAYSYSVKNGTQEHFREIYLGIWDDEEDFAKHVLMIMNQKLLHIGKLEGIISFAQQLFSGAYFSIKSETGIHVFRNI